MVTDSWFIDFTAYVDESKRPENFPRELHIKDVYNDIESVMHLQAKVNKKFIDLVTSAGLVVLKDEDAIIDEGKITFDKRVFVPWHMITYMKLDVQRMIPKFVNPQDSIVPSSSLPPEPTKEMVN